MSDVGEDDSLKERAFKLCQEFLGGVWENISLEDFRFSGIRGGLSNELYRCALPENFNGKLCDDCNEAPKEALMRIYGPVQDEQDSRLQEIAIFTLLSERNLGPKLYGLFTNGRLEEYVPSRPLNWNSVRTHATSIAKELAKIHAVQLPIRKKPIFSIQTYEWLEFVKENANKKDTSPIYNIFFNDEFKNEVDWLINEIEKAKSPVVFCNNDLQGGNVLLLDSPRSDGRNLMLIDFEFGAYNYRGFDIANHFNERCFDYRTTDSSFNCEVDPDRYPTEAEQIEFIDAYLGQLQKEGISFKSDSEMEKSILLKEIPLLRLAVHLYWIVGACKFDLVSTISFPYVDLAEASWDLYKQNKQKYTKGEF